MLEFSSCSAQTCKQVCPNACMTYCASYSSMFTVHMLHLFRKCICKFMTHCVIFPIFWMERCSNGTTAENKGFSDGATEAAPSGVQQASGYQSAWAGAPGQVSMADIVKMGRPQNRTSYSQNASLHNDLRFPADHSSKDYESGTSQAQHIPTNEEWPAMEKPTATHVQPEPYYAVDSEQHLEPSGITSVSVNQLPEAEVVQEVDEEDEYTENYGTDAAQSDSITNRKFLEDDSRGASLYENDLYKDMGSFQHHAPHDFHKGGFFFYNYC